MSIYVSMHVYGIRNNINVKYVSMYVYFCKYKSTYMVCTCTLFYLCGPNFKRNKRPSALFKIYLLKFQGPNNNNFKKIYLHKYENHPSPQYTIPFATVHLPHHGEKICTKEKTTRLWSSIGVLFLCAGGLGEK